MLIKNLKYHILCVSGFIVFLLCTLSLSKISYSFRYAEGKDISVNSLYYYVSEGLICGFLAYLLSNIILYTLEKYIDFGNIKPSSVARVTIIFFSTILLYTFSVWYLLQPVYDYYLGEKMEHSLVMKIVNIPYFTTFFAIWLFIIIAVKLFRYLNKVKINQLGLESSLRESQLNTLKGQINPHFMFNSLNNIRGLILEDAPRSREMITRLSEMLRYSLTKNGVNTIALNDELQTVENYIELSKIQFEERLIYIKQVDPGTLNMPVPPMVIQMLVENAVKHGIGKIKEGGEVRLLVEKKENTLVIKVQNSGSLSMEEGSTRLGLENIKKRLFLLYGNNADFILEEKNNFVEAKIVILT